jgi:hypothetical protein
VLGCGHQDHFGSPIIRDGRDAYGYAPRERYIERRGYEDRGYEDRGGIGFSAPGVSVGIGTDRY